MSSNSSSPSKTDITQIFKRLMSLPANKLCFDCHSKNPTWSSVTYGIFICIDCSGLHRSLGVHLTFVRSTSLDSNWSWVQLRQMQCGGNAAASAFFRQHNATSSDAQLKYKSRAAQLYREKLHNQAVQAIKTHGNKLFIQGPSLHGDNDNVIKEEQEERNGQEEDEQGKDFFSANHSASFPDNMPKLAETMKSSVSSSGEPKEGPNVEGLNSSSSQAPAPIRKSTLGKKRAPAKKSGGLGATRVKKDFSAIEKEAELADQVRSKVSSEQEKMDEEAMSSSMRLAYQDISVQQKKKEENLKRHDPKKAEQVERLGMGFRATSSGVSHSLLSDTITIVQEEPTGYSNKKSSRSSYMMDNLETNNDVDKEEEDSFRGFADASDKCSWENEFQKLKMENNSASKDKDSWGNSGFSNNSSSNNRSYSKPDSYSSGASTSVEASQKFGAAKAISSDMFFGDDRNGASDANLNRFQGSNSISSADYFNRTEVTPGSRIQSPDMDDVKESVRQGVTKVASKLSGMASGVYSQIQEKYGY